MPIYDVLLVMACLLMVGMSILVCLFVFRLLALWVVVDGVCIAFGCFWLLMPVLVAWLLVLLLFVDCGVDWFGVADLLTNLPVGLLWFGRLLLWYLLLMGVIDCVVCVGVSGFVYGY